MKLIFIGYPEGHPAGDADSINLGGDSAWHKGETREVDETVGEGLVQGGLFAEVKESDTKVASSAKAVLVADAKTTTSAGDNK